MRAWKQTNCPFDLMVLGAHPDDAELLCGGIIAKMKDRGKGVVVVDVTEGELSSNGTVASRRRETEAASEILALDQRINLGFSDGKLHRSETLVDGLVDVLRECCPSVVIGPPPSCRHPDHQALHEALKKAHYFCGLKKYRDSTPSIARPQLFHYLEMEDDKGDVLIDVSLQWERRVAAVKAYESQFMRSEGAEPTLINSGFLENLDRRYRQCGASIGVEYAEPLLTTIPSRMDLPTDWL